MGYTIRVILLLVHVQSVKSSYCVTLQKEKEKQEKRYKESLLLHVEKGTDGILTVVWDNVQAHYRSRQKRVASRSFFFSAQRLKQRLPQTDRDTKKWTGRLLWNDRQSNESVDLLKPSLDVFG